MGLVCINGGQCGGINVPWDMGKESLGLGPNIGLSFCSIAAFSLLLLGMKEGICERLTDRYDGCSGFVGIVVDLIMDIIHTSNVMALFYLQVCRGGEASLGHCLWERPWEKPYPSR